MYICMECRKMVLMNLFSGKEWRRRPGEWTRGHSGGRREGTKGGTSVDMFAPRVRGAAGEKRRAAQEPRLWWWDGGPVGDGGRFRRRGCVCSSGWFTLPWASLIAQLVKNPPAVQETWVLGLGWKGPLEKGKAPHSSILAWRIPWTV